ncbi:MAG: glycosyltransferase [Micromonosporaceae bacterium]|nr:glycosyltransferase [Micromonosporaceae bacterium]
MIERQRANHGRSGIDRAAVVIPAHNEQELLPECLQRVNAAVAAAGLPTRVIVVLDDCTDDSLASARVYGVSTVEIRARSVGVARATGTELALADRPLADRVPEDQTPGSGRAGALRAVPDGPAGNGPAGYGRQAEPDGRAGAGEHRTNGYRRPGDLAGDLARLDGHHPGGRLAQPEPGWSAQAGIWLAYTDADSRVPEDWLVRQLRHARAGAEVLVGTVTVEDWSDWPDGLAKAYEEGYRRGQGRHVHGANLGMTGSAYRSAGGFPDLPVGEDGALVAAAHRAGLRVVYATDLPVVTSARRQGRAPGGFSAFLAGLAARL